MEHYVTKLPIDAVLMAGGKGERLRPLTEKTPMPLIKVGDKCMSLIIILIVCFHTGLNHISVTVNYLGDQIEEHFREERDGVKIVTVREPKYLGTIGSIKFVGNFYNDTVLVMNSDLFTNIDFEDFFLHFCQHDADMSVAAVPYVSEGAIRCVQSRRTRNQGRYRETYHQLLCKRRYIPYQTQIA
ncbi:MAG: sugar phosphate nucleotidyltransferase [Phocaeicola vulgatus]